MSLRAPALRLLLGLGLLFAGHASAGITIFDPDELIRAPGFSSVRIGGKIKAVGWRGHGRSTTPRPHVAALADLQLSPPPGASDLVLELDGPLIVEGRTEDGDAVRLELDVKQLVVPLEDPDASTITLDLALPDWLADAAEGGLVVKPGHPLHDALVVSLRDGVLAVPAR